MMQLLTSITAVSLTAFTLLHLATISSALLTLDVIRNLTEGTDGYRERILDAEGGLGVGVGLGSGGGDGGQVVLGGEGDEGEIEDVSFFLLFFIVELVFDGRVGVLRRRGVGRKGEWEGNLRSISQSWGGC